MKMDGWYLPILCVYLCLECYTHAEFMYIVNRSLCKLKLHLMVAIIRMVPEAKVTVQNYSSLV